MLEKDAVFTGLIVGAIVPVVGYLAVEQIFSLLSYMDLMEYVSGGGVSRRMRTLTLLGICCNLIPLNIFRKRKWDNSMRGIVFPTLLYVGGWIWKFGTILF